MKKSNKIGISLIAVMLTFLFFIIVMIIANIAPFGDYSFAGYDCLQQYLPFFSELHEKLRGLLSGDGGKSILYSWNGGLGYSFLAVFFYYLASPLNLIVAFFERESLTSVVSVLIVVKASLAAGSFCLYLLSKWDRKDDESRGNRISGIAITIAFAMGYALSSYILGFYYNIMWLDSFAIFPLIVLGLERLIDEKSPVFYTIMLFVSIWCNYYISFMICIFLVLWFCVYSLSKKGRLVRSIGSFALYSIIAAGMAAIPLLISAYALSVTQTVDYGMFGNVWYTNIFRLLGGQFMFSRPILAVPYNGVANIYCGMLAIVLFFVYLVSKVSVREKTLHVLLIILLVISMNYDPLNYVWHGFHEQNGIPNRFSFCFIFVMLVIGFNTIIKFEKTKLAPVASAIIVAFIYPIICFAGYDFDGMISSKAMVGIAIVLVLIYGSVIACICVKPEFKNKAVCVLAVMMAVELMINGVVCIKNNELDETDYYMSYVNGRRGDIDKVQSIPDDDGFYRETIYDNIINNEDTYHSIRGVSLFSSTQNGDIVNTMGNLGFYYSANQYYYIGATGITDDLLGVRYIHSMSDGVTVNEDSLSIGYAVNKDVLSYDMAESHDKALMQNNLLYAMTGIGGHLRPAEVEVFGQGLNCEVVITQGTPALVTVNSDGGSMTDIMIGFTASEDGEYYINPIYENFYDGTVYVNNEAIDSNKTYNRMIGVSLKEGDVVNLVFECAANGSSENVIPVFISRYYPENEKEAVNALKAGEIKINKFGDNRLSGEVNINEGQVLFTSIPYDEGWTIIDNGVEVDSIELLGGFLGVELSPGTHNVEFRFFPRGLYQGIVIMAASWIMFFAFLYLKKSKKKNVDHQD